MHPHQCPARKYVLTTALTPKILCALSTRKWRILIDEYQKIEHILENNDYILVSVNLDCIFFFFSVKNGRKALKYFFHNVAAPKILVGLLPWIQPVLLMGCGCKHPFRSFKN